MEKMLLLVAILSMIVITSNFAHDPYSTFIRDLLRPAHYCSFRTGENPTVS